MELGAAPAPSQAHLNLVAGGGNRHGKAVGLRWGDRRHRSGPPGLPDPAVPSLFSLGREHPPHCCHATKSDQITELSWPISSFRGSEILASIFDVPWKKAEKEKMGLRAGARPPSWLRSTADTATGWGKPTPTDPA